MTISEQEQRTRMKPGYCKESNSDSSENEFESSGELSEHQQSNIGYSQDATFSDSFLRELEDEDSDSDLTSSNSVQNSVVHDEETAKDESHCTTFLGSTLTVKEIFNHQFKHKCIEVTGVTTNVESIKQKRCRVLGRQSKKLKEVPSELCSEVYNVLVEDNHNCMYNLVISTG